MTQGDDMKKTGLLVILLILLVSQAWGEGSGEINLLDEFEYSGIEILHIDKASIFRIEVIGGSGRKLEAQIFGSNEKRFEVKHDKRGNELFVWVDWKTTFFNVNVRNTKMIFRVPEEIDLDIATTTGGILVESCNGIKKLHTSTGSVKVSNSIGDIEAATSTGSHMYEDIDGNLSIRSTTGSHEYINIAGNLSVYSSTGGQRYRKIDGDIEAESSTGSIIIADQEGRLYLRSSTGSQRGENILIKSDSSFKTTTGSIEFDFLNAPESFTFDLSSGTGRITVGKSTIRGRLLFGSGRIKITGSSSTGSQTYR